MNHNYKPSPYHIRHDLNIKVDFETAEDIQEKLRRMIDRTDKPEPFFYSIAIWILSNDPETGKITKGKRHMMCGQWYVSQLDQIKELVGDTNGDRVKIGHPEVSLEEVLEEVNAEVNQYQIEAKRQAEVAARYDEAVDNYECLTEEYYYNGFKLMRAQSDLDRNNILEDIRDELKTISGALKDIGKELSER